MSSSNNDVVISRASPHTVKKFELIENYVRSWAQKLMLYDCCDDLIFIDCMCNSGVYHDDDGKEILGTPLRIANILRDVSGQYPRKHIFIYFNDMDKEKTDLLQSRLPKNKNNFTITVTTKDGNKLLKEIGPQLKQNSRLHFFLLYDPYDASIDWNALSPFFRNWGEVLINHMISDPIRAIRQVKTDKARQKYMDTYLIDDLERLIPFGSDKNAYEQRLEAIIKVMKGSPNRKYYVASFPFFNTRNSLLYDLVHCTSNEKGFKLFKTTAWKTFGDKSSLKNRHGNEDQMILDFDGNGIVTSEIDENCYNINDIVDYLQRLFNGMQNVPLNNLWSILDEHPIFPSDGYKTQIKSLLKINYGAIISKSTITFSDRRQ